MSTVPRLESLFAYDRTRGPIAVTSKQIHRRLADLVLGSPTHLLTARTIAKEVAQDLHLDDLEVVSIDWQLNHDGKHVPFIIIDGPALEKNVLFARRLEHKKYNIMTSTTDLWSISWFSVVLQIRHHLPIDEGQRKMLQDALCEGPLIPFAQYFSKNINSQIVRYICRSGNMTESSAAGSAQAAKLRDLTGLDVSLKETVPGYIPGSLPKPVLPLYFSYSSQQFDLNGVRSKSVKTVTEWLGGLVHKTPLQNKRERSESQDHTLPIAKRVSAAPTAPAAPVETPRTLGSAPAGPAAPVERQSMVKKALPTAEQGASAPAPSPKTPAAPDNESLKDLSAEKDVKKAGLIKEIEALEKALQSKRKELAEYE